MSLYVYLSILQDERVLRFHRQSASVRLVTQSALQCHSYLRCPVLPYPHSTRPSSRCWSNPHVIQDASSGRRNINGQSETGKSQVHSLNAPPSSALQASASTASCFNNIFITTTFLMDARASKSSSQVKPAKTLYDRQYRWYCITQFDSVQSQSTITLFYIVSFCQVKS